MWEDIERGINRQSKRMRCALKFEGILKVKSKKINQKNKNIKLLQENYADSFSKNRSIKKESIKRNERIKTIETEIESWKTCFQTQRK
mgnify:CR=1 FL=1